MDAGIAGLIRDFQAGRSEVAPMLASALLRVPGTHVEGPRKTLMTIPTIGTTLKLLSPWTFFLYNEGRNLTFARRVFTTAENKGALTIQAGTILKVDRIYIRQNLKDFDSITFVIKKSDQLDLYNTKIKGRFWARLADVNRMVVEVDGIDISDEPEVQNAEINIREEDKTEILSKRLRDAIKPINNSKAVYAIEFITSLRTCNGRWVKAASTEYYSNRFIDRYDWVVDRFPTMADLTLITKEDLRIMPKVGSTAIKSLVNLLTAVGLELRELPGKEAREEAEKIRSTVELYSKGGYSIYPAIR